MAAASSRASYTVARPQVGSSGGVRHLRPDAGGLRLGFFQKGFALMLAPLAEPLRRRFRRRRDRPLQVGVVKGTTSRPSYRPLQVTPTPIFILCVPRSGSTLLQRLLASHADISTTSEPWVLIHQIYAMRESGIRAEYSHPTSARALEAFASEYLPGGVDGYWAAVRDFTLRLYEQAAQGKQFFLDKGPRNGFVADDILRIFPGGRFIFLWRNPLAIASSATETFGAGKFNIRGAHRADLYEGIPRLIDAYEANSERVHALRYEDLVTTPDAEIRRALDYIGLPFDDSLTSRFTELPMPNPRFWDPGGTLEYRSVSTEPLDKWKQTMTPAVRKRWCRRYLKWLAHERAALMGYDLNELLAEARALRPKPRHIIRHLAVLGKDRIRRRLQIP